ncbi:MAG: energy-coupling factor transporter transmembrane protein EcfT [Clostridia bacterium]|nr:energy-coupling factor transporter transmembrane protein EcfT [Clostridia bacterium]
MKAVTLGQYVAGDTALHRLDARTKLVGLALLILALFVTSSGAVYGAIAALLAAATVAARARLDALWRGLRPILVLVLITSAINAFSVPGEALARVGPLALTRPGLAIAAALGVRLLLLVWATTLLTMTTSPLLLTDALERLLTPLKRVRFPVHELALMMSIALRFIPTIFDEADRIMKAQASRGADFESGSLWRRAQALVPVLVPLFVAAFRRAEDLALAMEARAYAGGEARTRYRETRMGARDWLALAALAALAAWALAARGAGPA